MLKSMEQQQTGSANDSDVTKPDTSMCVVIRILSA